MQGSRPRQKSTKEITNDSKHLYIRQKTLCVSILQKTKRDYFNPNKAGLFEGSFS